MLGITDLGTYIIGVVAIILLPGANTMFCLTVAGRYGVMNGYKAAIGIFLGNAVLMATSALGGASILLAMPHLFGLLQGLGCAYLIYIGLKLLWNGIGKWRNEEAKSVSVPALSPVKHIFKQALLLSLLNPQTIFFFLSFFVQFVDKTYPYPMISFTALAGIYQLASLMYLSLLIFTGASVVAWFGHRRRLAGSVMVSIGLSFIGFAAKLWAATVK